MNKDEKNPQTKDVSELSTLGKTLFFMMFIGLIAFFVWMVLNGVK